MKVNELMVGDLVAYKDKFDRISSIGADFACVGCRLTRVRNEELNNVEPIPLTEDILKANVFKKSYTYNMNAHYSRNGVGVTLNLASYTTTILGKLVIIKYVHELQHALRLCGLNELADKFKVEYKPSEKSEGTVTENKDK